MKKILFFLIIVVIPILLSGCKKDSPVPNDTEVDVFLYVSTLDGNFQIKHKDEKGNIVDKKFTAPNKFDYTYKSKIGQTIYLYAKHNGDAYQPSLNGLTIVIQASYPKTSWQITNPVALVTKTHKGVTEIIYEVKVPTIKEIEDAKELPFYNSIN
ncbi:MULTISPECIES: hypothetical protein [unclassified Sphingobacterium]|uniref:hypothetical protein n=1 Tax=unclassified Sphingobacterium TaxID=2609468 RepID=UPI0025F4CEA4|nr:MULTISPECIES: hypothetical protein [unclassified Sphingobacterium]